jgi:hypothetical protein
MKTDPFVLTNDILVTASSIEGATRHYIHEIIKSRALDTYIDLLRRIGYLDKKGDRYFTTDGGTKYIAIFNNRESADSKSL